MTNKGIDVNIDKLRELLFELRSAISITRYNIKDKRYCNLLDIIADDIEKEIGEK